MNAENSFFFFVLGKAKYQILYLDFIIHKNPHNFLSYQLIFSYQSLHFEINFSHLFPCQTVYVSLPMHVTYLTNLISLLYLMESTVLPKQIYLSSYYSIPLKTKVNSCYNSTYIFFDLMYMFVEGRRGNNNSEVSGSYSIP